MDGIATEPHGTGTQDTGGACTKALLTPDTSHTGRVVAVKEPDEAASDCCSREEEEEASEDWEDAHGRGG